MSLKTEIFIATIIVAAFMLAGVWVGYRIGHKAPPEPIARAVPAKVAPEVVHETTADTPIKSGTMRTYAPAAKTRLKLPDNVVNDATQQIIAASRVKADDHPQTVTTTINTDTGETETYVHEEPLPWLAWDTRGDAGFYLGLKNGEKAARLEVRQGVLAIKAAHIGVIASADQPLGGPIRVGTFVGAGVWMRW